MSLVHESVDIFLSEPPDGHVLRTFIRLSTLPARLLFDPDDDLNLIEMLGILVLIAVTWSAWRGAGAVRETEKRDRLRDAMWLWLLWLLGIAGCLTTLDLARSTHHLAYTRYAMLASLPVYAMLAGAVDHGRSAWSKYVVPGAVLLLTIATVRTGYDRHNPDVRATGAYLASIATPGEPLLIVSPNQEGRDAQMLYVGLDLYDKNLLPRPLVILTHPPSPALLKELGPGREAILIKWDDDPVDDAIPGATEIDHAAPGLGVCYRVRLPK
jgi:hypothetical protein